MYETLLPEGTVQAAPEQSAATKDAPQSGEVRQPVPLESLGVVATPQIVTISAQVPSLEVSPTQVQSSSAHSRGWLGRLLRFQFPLGKPDSAPKPTGIDVVERLEKRGYVRTAPHLSTQVADKTRTNVFTFDTHKRHGTMTEHEGLQELDTFLRDRPTVPELVSLRETLTFIGEKEYAEAAAGLAAYWKHHLDSSDSTQLCLLSYISAHGVIKSDQYLLERVLEHFSDQELRRYRGRLVFDPSHLTADPASTKIVLLDDWILSGSQMQAAISRVQSRLHKYSATRYTSSLEVNLITTSRKRLSSQKFESQLGVRVPIRAYYVAHNAHKHCSDTGTHISGTHSSTDFDFSSIFSRYTSTPMLAYVERAYYTSSRPEYHRALELLGLNTA